MIHWFLHRAQWLPIMKINCLNQESCKLLDSLRAMIASILFVTEREETKCHFYSLKLVVASVVALFARSNLKFDYFFFFVNKLYRIANNVLSLASNELKSLDEWISIYFYNNLVVCWLFNEPSINFHILFCCFFSDAE